jgi:twitching motility protein PilI
MSNTALDLFRELERNYEHAATSRPAADEHVMLWVGTHLGIAGVSLLVGAGELDEIIETPAVTRIPGTKPWVVGLAAHKGGLLPIFSGDVFFRGAPYSGRVREYCMVVRRHGLHFGLTLSGVHRDMKFPLEERDMSIPVDPDFADYCLGGFHHDGNFLAVLDIDKLVADAELSSASASEGDLNEDKNS